MVGKYDFGKDEGEVGAGADAFDFGGVNDAGRSFRGLSMDHVTADYGYALKGQELKSDKLVGQQVPGTCTYASWEALQDNSIRWGVPPVGVKAMNGKYLEN